jgi:hypothetical protein
MIRYRIRVEPNAMDWVALALLVAGACALAYACWRI